MQVPEVTPQQNWPDKILDSGMYLTTVVIAEGKRRNDFVPVFVKTPPKTFLKYIIQIKW